MPIKHEELESLGRMAKAYSDALFTCNRLYELGRGGELNGLQDLHYAGAVLNAFLRIDTIIRYTLTSSKCDHACRSSAIVDLMEAQKSALAKLG